nr:reverse transcriptase domain-containing protein [Tanacetum cinerariifolium]
MDFRVTMLKHLDKFLHVTQSIKVNGVTYDALHLLTLRHRDIINAAAGGTFMKRRPEKCYDLIENMTAHHNDWDTSIQRSESSSSITSFFDPKIVALKDEMAEIKKNLMKVLQINKQVKAVAHNCETCGGPHSYNYCPAITNMTSLKNSNLELKNMFGQFMKMYTASSSGSGTLPSNTITKPKEDLKDRSISRPVRVAEDVFVKVGTFHFPADFVVVDFDADPRVSLVLERSFLKTGRALIDVYEGELTLHGDILLFEEFLNDDPLSPPLPPQELKVVEPTNENLLLMNHPWSNEKSHFMVKDGIVLGHKISKNGIEFPKAMLKYGVTHRLATAYHPQTSGQVEVSNRGLKRILERTVGENRSFWSDKLDDALWAFRTAFKTPIGCTPYKLVYGKAFLLNELNGLHDQAYENSLIYKEKTKRIHDSKIKDRVFNLGDRVLLFNSRLKIFSSKIKTRWSGPFTITQMFPYGTIELSQTDGPNFKVNGHRLKHYFGEDIPKMVVPDLQTFPKDQ